MALVFSAFTPHTPLLLPQIGKDHRSLLKQTAAAFDALQHELYAARPDTIFILSAHGELLPEAFTLNLNPVFTVSFYDFGDVVTKQTYKSDIGLTHHIKEQLETKLPITLVTNPTVDHGVGVPLYMLLEHFGTNVPKIVPIMFSMLDFDAHYSFGMHLQQEIINSTKRIAIIGSGELSHRLTKKSPAGYSPKGKEFDEQVKTLLEANKGPQLVKLPPSLVEQAGECGFRALLIQLGIMNSVNYKTQILSYEFPFGIGYLTVNFQLQ